MTRTARRTTTGLLGLAISVGAAGHTAPGFA
jgi:hypothetical protein